VNIPSAGTYQVNFRIASFYTGAQFQLRKFDGTVLATLTVPNTGNWQSWTTISTNVALPAGTQTLRIFTSNANGGWNLNWWEMVMVTPTNSPPTVNAGTDQAINLPASSITLTGTVSDPDGFISTYAWTKISGPSGSTFGSASSISTTVNGLVQGSYVFRLTVTDNSGSTASDDVAVTVNAASPSNIIHVEAENYSSMNGIQTENTADAGGGLNVGWQDTGDWMDYNVNIPSAGTYQVNFRIASFYTGAQFQLRKFDGTVLATLTVPNTSNWQSWTTISTNVALPAGAQTLRIFTSNANGGWNLNWWEITTRSTTPVSGQNTSVSQLPLSQEQKAAVKVFPDPITDRFLLKVDNQLTGKLIVSVVNVAGQSLKQFHLNKVAKGCSQWSLSAGSIPVGTCVLQVNMNSWKQSIKLIKE
jgi:hypothetical protein